LTTLLDQRNAFHRSVLSEHLSLYNPETQGRLDALTSAFTGRGIDPTTAHQQAIASLDHTLSLQSSILSFADTFWVVGMAFLASLPLLLLLGKGRKGQAPTGGH
jgi:DHA2 family multidrug resistance protein